MHISIYKYIYMHICICIYIIYIYIYIYIHIMCFADYHIIEINIDINDVTL